MMARARGASMHAVIAHSGVAASGESQENESAPVSLLVLNDHPVLRSALKWKLVATSTRCVSAEAVSISDAVSLSRHLKVDAVIVDLRIGDGNSEGVDLVSELSKRLPDVPVIVYSDHFSTGYLKSMASAGAVGYIMKSAGPDRLMSVVGNVIAGKTDFPVSASARAAV